MSTYKVPCGRTIGHGMACCTGMLCAGCEEVSVLRQAMQEFCDRVDACEVRSVKTYAKFKELLPPAETLTMSKWNHEDIKAKVKELGGWIDSRAGKIRFPSQSIANDFVQWYENGGKP